MFIITDLFADATPGVVENRVLISRHRRVQLLQNNLHAAAAVHKPTDVVHHGSLTERAGALVGRPEVNVFKHTFRRQNERCRVKANNLTSALIIPLPETVSLQENTQREVILAVELHRDNPAKSKVAVSEDKFPCEV